MSQQETLIRTSLYLQHTSLGAKMVPFAGYEMPVSYTGINEEHHAVRNAVGMFDVSHMGEFMVRGPQALAFLQWVTSNDVAALTPGKVQYSCLPNAEGGIVDDLLVYCMAEEEYMLVVNASNIDKDWNHLQNQVGTFDCGMHNLSEELSLLAVQGPKAMELLQTLTEVNLADIPYYHFAVGRMAGLDDIIISNTGYTGAGGFELYVPNHLAAEMWDSIMTAGRPFGIKPAGLGCRDTLRLEMGFCLYGNDINDHTSPLEAGLGWITKFTKKFLNSDALEEQKKAGLQRKLIGLVLEDKSIARQGYEVFASAEEGAEAVGMITSGTLSPTLGYPIAMVYLPAALAKEGTEVYVQIRQKKVPARVAKFPFLPK